MWSSLPPPVLLDIFHRLPICDLFSAALTCRNWFTVYDSASLWKGVKFEFSRNRQNDETKQIKVIEKYGSYFQTVQIHLNQANPTDRRSALELIQRLAFVDGRQITKLSIIFEGRNPLFYGGQEFLQVLQIFLASSPPGILRRKSLIHVDFSRFPILLRDEVIHLLALNNPTLTTLDIQNKQFICKVTSDCLSIVAHYCRNLVDLRVYHVSLDDKVLSVLPKSLKHLSIFCLRQEHADLSYAAWRQLVNSNPDLSVTLKFDHLVPLWKYREVLKDDIPLDNLYIQSFTMVREEIEIALEIFAKRLKTFHITSQPSEELDIATIKIATECDYLQQLHVYCSLDEATIENVHDLKPNLAVNPKCFTLKNFIERSPDIADAILEEIESKCK